MFTTGIFARQSQQLLIEEEATQRNNTKRCYSLKSNEFKAFCLRVYGEGPYPYVVTEEKLFGFLYYQAYRGKRRKTNSANPGVFNFEEYTNIMAMSAEQIQSLHDVCGYDNLNQNLCAVLKIWKEQVDLNANNLSKGNK
jgi:hypothetical protein